MTKAEQILEKHSGLFISPTPFVINSQEELTSIPGYVKETGNRVAGAITGGVGGAILGKVIGGSVSILTEKPGFSKVLPYIGAYLGAVGNSYSSLRKTERNANVSPTGPIKYFLRSIGGHIGNAAIPVLGYPLGDYIFSRYIGKYKPKSN